MKCPYCKGTGVLDAKILHPKKSKKVVEIEKVVDDYIKRGILPSYQTVADDLAIGKTAAYMRLRYYRGIMKTK